MYCSFLEDQKWLRNISWYVYSPAPNCVNECKTMSCRCQKMICLSEAIQFKYAHTILCVYVHIYYTWLITEWRHTQQCSGISPVFSTVLSPVLLFSDPLSYVSSLLIKFKESDMVLEIKDSKVAWKASILHVYSITAAQI